MKEAIYYNEEENIIATVYYSNGVFVSSSKKMATDVNIPKEQYNLLLEKLLQKYTFIGYL